VEDPIYKTLTCQEISGCKIVDLAAGRECEAPSLRFVELAELCDRMAWDEQARVVLLCFDGEMAEPAPRWGSERSSWVEPVAKLRQPVIAAIHGDAVGLGLELALACDFRIGTENARFGFPQICEGKIPSNGGTQRLPRLVGPTKAAQMILTGELIDSEEARRVGLLHRIVSSRALMDSAMEVAQEMAAKSPLSLGYAKEALYSGQDLTLDQGLRMEMDLYLLLFSTSDRTEGITAFREKRKPNFKGI
jgi:enoyl-CoA hydratase/carnithine racemase